MSADVQWAVIRKNSCFLVKSNGKTLSKEPNNIKGLNSMRYNGLINKKVLGVEPAPSGKGVVLTYKKKSKNTPRKRRIEYRPSKMYTSVTLTKDSRHTIKTIRNVCRNSYRRDLEDAAVRRACLILRSQKPTAGVQKKRSRRKRN